MNISTVGLDLANQVHAIDDTGQVIVAGRCAGVR